MKKHIYLSQDLQQKQNQLIMLQPKMQQALRYLQAPVTELAAMIELEMENNPILEYSQELQEGIEEVKSDDVEREVDFDDDDFSVFEDMDEDYDDHFSQDEAFSKERNRDLEGKRAFAINSLEYQESLFQHLMHEAEETFETKQELQAAEAIIGNINAHGYLETPLEEIQTTTGFSMNFLEKVLQEIQQFDPPGVGARSIQEALLIQLRRRNCENSLAYELIESHYDDILHNRLPKIQKDLSVTYEELEEAIHKDISHLDIHPGMEYSLPRNPGIVPDVLISDEEEGKLSIAINREGVPNVCINIQYLKMFAEQKTDKEVSHYIKKKMQSAKWLMKNIVQRNDTLYRIMDYILEKQKDYFTSPQGQLVPMTMKEIAEHMDVHDSTVVRAVSEKYASTPRGVIAIRDFFSVSYETDEGKTLSSKSVQKTLQKMIDREDKRKPLSDQKLSKLLEKQGIHCARRTVAKYRYELNIGNTQQRRQYKS